MGLVALDAIDDALRLTRSLAEKLTITGWIRLALVVAFVGGFGSASFQGNAPASAISNPDGLKRTVDGVAADVPVLVVTVLVVFGVGIGYLLVRSLLEFAFYESLCTRDVHLWRSVAERWTQGLRLFAFRTVLAGIVAATLSALAWLTIYDGRISPTSVGPIVVAAGVLGGYAVVAGFTTNFVVPVMLSEGGGVLAAWARFGGVLSAAAHQYAAYLLVGAVLRFVVDIVLLAVITLYAFALAVPLVFFGVLPVIVNPGSIVFLLLVAPFVLAYLLLFFAGAAVLRVPAVAYLRYYALLVLTGTDTDLDLLSGFAGESGGFDFEEH